MTFSPSNRALFAYVLLKLDGIGRVSAGQIIRQFGDYETLVKFPHEQIKLRLKGVPKVDKLIQQLLDAEKMAQAIALAKAELASLQQKRIELCAPGDQHWPAMIDKLPNAQKPALIYLFGNSALLSQKTVAFYADPPLVESGHEGAQALIRYLHKKEIHPVAGISNGFDVVVHKTSSDAPNIPRSIMVTNAGMAKTPTNMRSVVATTVRSGGLMVSSFPLNHGPFDHDDREKCYLQSALAKPLVFVNPRPKTFSHEVMMASIDAGRSVFAFPDPEHDIPSAVHPILGEADFDWVAMAAS